jgi:hypothetical protein
MLATSEEYWLLPTFSFTRPLVWFTNNVVLIAMAGTSLCNGCEMANMRYMTDGGQGAKFYQSNARRTGNAELQMRSHVVKESRHHR